MSGRTFGDASMPLVSRTSHSLLGRPGAMLDRLAEPRRFTALVIVNAGLLWFILLSGGLVRLTGSGLGCPDWPLCDGGVVPAAGYHQVIEYTNRLASAFILLVTVITFLTARRITKPTSTLRGYAFWAMAMSVLQVPLGGLTVLSDLHPLMVGSHFLLSIGALTMGVLLVITTDDHRHGRIRATDRRRGPFAGLSALALLAVIVTGVLVTAAGPHSGDDDVLKRFGDLEAAAWLHVRVVAVLVVLMVVLAVWMRREPPTDPRANRAVAVFLPLLAIQIALGEVQYRHGLPWQVVVAHVAVGGLVWVSGVTLAWRVGRPPRTAGGPDAPAPPSQREPVGAAASAV